MSPVLPGGDANLFVAADPANSASLKLVAPGERFTLPLGVGPGGEACAAT